MNLHSTLSTHVQKPSSWDSSVGTFCTEVLRWCNRQDYTECAWVRGRTSTTNNWLCRRMTELQIRVSKTICKWNSVVREILQNFSPCWNTRNCHGISSNHCQVFNNFNFSRSSSHSSSWHLHHCFDKVLEFILMRRITQSHELHTCPPPIPFWKDVKRTQKRNSIHNFPRRWCNSPWIAWSCVECWTS